MIPMPGHSHWYPLPRNTSSLSCLNNFLWSNSIPPRNYRRHPHRYIHSFQRTTLWVNPDDQHEQYQNRWRAEHLLRVEILIQKKKPPRAVPHSLTDQLALARENEISFQRYFLVSCSMELYPPGSYSQNSDFSEYQELKHQED